MGIPERFKVAGLGFLGLLVSFGMRSVFALIMVYVLRGDTDETQSIFKECTINGTAYDLRLPWQVKTSQYLNTAYFVGYVVTQLPGGYLAVRFSSSRVFGLAILLSSSLMIILAFVITYGSEIVFVIRTVQGLLEGVCIPALNGVLSAWSLASEKSRMVTFTFSGAYISTAVALLTSGATTCYISWHSGLFIYGGVGCIFSVVWLCLVYDTPDENPRLSEGERNLFHIEGPKVLSSSKIMAESVPYKSILTSLPVSAIFVGNFCRNWIFSMQTTELPQYFSDAYQMNIASIGFVAALPEIFMTISVIFGGIFFDKLIQSGKITTTVGRKIAQSTGFGVESLFLFTLVFIADFRLATIFLCIGVGFSGLAISGYQVNPLDLAPQYVHILTGFSRLSCIGSILSTVVAGLLRQKNVESWQEIFLIAAVIHFTGVIYYAIFASGERQSWADDHDTSIERTESTLKIVSFQELEYKTFK